MLTMVCVLAGAVAQALLRKGGEKLRSETASVGKKSFNTYIHFVEKDLVDI